MKKLLVVTFVLVSSLLSNAYSQTITKHCVDSNQAKFCFMSELTGENNQQKLYTDEENYNIYINSSFTNHLEIALYDTKLIQPTYFVTWTTNENNELVYKICDCQRPLDASCALGTLGGAGLGALNGGKFGVWGGVIGGVFGGLMGAAGSGCFN